MYNFGKSEKKNYGLRLELVLSSWPVWQYGLWSFQGRDTKLERILHKNQHTKRKFLNFENWTLSLAKMYVSSTLSDGVRSKFWADF